MAVITLKVNPDGSVSPSLLMVPGPLPKLDGETVGRGLPHEQRVVTPNDATAPDKAPDLKED